MEPATYSIQRIHSTDLKTGLIKRTFSKMFSQNMEESAWPPILDFLELSVTWKSDRSIEFLFTSNIYGGMILYSKLYSRSNIFFLFLTQLAAHQRPLSRISKVFLCMFESKYCASWTWILCCLDKNIISYESIYLMFISGHTFQGQNLGARLLHILGPK